MAAPRRTPEELGIEGYFTGLRYQDIASPAGV